MMTAEVKALETYMQHKLRWVFPQDLEEGQEAAIHVVGIAIAPFFDFYGDRFANFGSFFTGKVERILDENGNLIAVQIGFYWIPEDLLDHPRVTAVIET
jgi:hypothetical protein